jgi:hypothetical protein
MGNMPGPERKPNEPTSVAISAASSKADAKRAAAISKRTKANKQRMGT